VVSGKWRWAPNPNRHVIKTARGRLAYSWSFLLYLIYKIMFTNLSPFSSLFIQKNVAFNVCHLHVLPKNASQYWVPSLPEDKLMSNNNLNTARHQEESYLGFHKRICIIRQKVARSVVGKCVVWTVGRHYNWGTQYNCGKSFCGHCIA